MVNAVALTVWAIVVLFALMAGAALRASLAAQVPVALGGMGTAIASVASGKPVFAWISVGLACVVTVLASAGARSLIYDASDTMPAVRYQVKEMSALFLGLELTMLAAVIPLCIGVALS
jgi:hypothetical protein